MAKMEFTCTGCRNGCEIEINYDNDHEDTDVTGNGCMRGILYANQRVMEERERAE